MNWLLWIAGVWLAATVVSLAFLLRWMAEGKRFDEASLWEYLVGSALGLLEDCACGDPRPRNEDWVHTLDGCSPAREHIGGS